MARNRFSALRGPRVGYAYGEWTVEEMLRQRAAGAQRMVSSGTVRFRG